MKTIKCKCGKCKKTFSVIDAGESDLELIISESNDSANFIINKVDLCRLITSKNE